MFHVIDRCLQAQRTTQHSRTGASRAPAANQTPGAATAGNHGPDPTRRHQEPPDYRRMDHIDDHDLERYHLGMIRTEAELAPFEEHLLACAECAERAEEAADFVDAKPPERSNRKSELWTDPVRDTLCQITV